MTSSQQDYSEKCVQRISQLLNKLDIREYFELYYWPILGFVWGILTLTTSYSISVLNGHVYKYFPYISNTGALPPESCIFGAMMDIGALIITVILYVRYRQVDIEIDAGHIHIGKELNTLSLWLAAAIPTGLSIVGHFQETSIYAVHIIGAILCIGVGSAYLLVQTKISFADKLKLDPNNPNYKFDRFILYVRVVISYASYPLLFTTVIYGGLSLMEFKGQSVIWWTEEDGGFQQRLISTFSEWILVVSMFIYILSFANDFKTFKFGTINFLIKDVEITQNK